MGSGDAQAALEGVNITADARDIERAVQSGLAAPASALNLKHYNLYSF